MICRVGMNKNNMILHHTVFEVITVCDLTSKSDGSSVMPQGTFLMYFGDAMHCHLIPLNIR